MPQDMDHRLESHVSFHEWMDHLRFVKVDLLQPPCPPAMWRPRGRLKPWARAHVAWDVWPMLESLPLLMICSQGKRGTAFLGQWLGELKVSLWGAAWAGHAQAGHARAGHAQEGWPWDGKCLAIGFAHFRFCSHPYQSSPLSLSGPQVQQPGCLGIPCVQHAPVQANLRDLQNATMD